MKNIKIVLILMILNVSAFSQRIDLEKKVSIKFENVLLKDALDLLGKKTDVSFAYDSSPALNKKVKKTFKNEKLKIILDKLLKDTGLEYKLIGKNITIFMPIKGDNNSDKSSNKKKSVTVSGYIYDTETGEVLIGCSVYDKKDYTAVASNSFGFYSLSLSEKTKDNIIVFAYGGYESQEYKVRGNTKLNVKLKTSNASIEEVVVNGERNNEQIISADMGKIKLKSAEINMIPSVGGETDVLKSVTLLPGIKQGVDGSSGFYVRGGGPDQNLILLDGVPMYNPYHMWGFLSTFNADAINNIEITKGSFPARYGGRLSSVLDITMKEGNNQAWQKDFTIGLLSAKASVSGPVIKGKSSIMVSARRTYADLIIVPILKYQSKKYGSNEKQGYNFTDLNLKYNYKISEKDRIFFSGFYSRDKFYFDQSSENKVETATVTENMNFLKGWSNLVGNIRWNRLLSNRLFVNTTAYYSDYNYYTNSLAEVKSTDTDIASESENKIEYNSNIKDIALKQDYQFYLNEKQTINFGIGAISHNFKPGVNAFFSKTDKETINNIIKNKNIQATELSLYAEDNFDLSKVIKINAGVHVSGFLVQNSKYYSIQPRISSRFLINKNLSLKLGYSEMTQYVHMLSSSGITQSSDLWVPSTDLVKPQKSKQFSAGSALLFGKSYQIETDVYYKTMDNLIDYKDGASFLSTATDWEDRVSFGNGYSYGAEIFLKKKKGKFTGWLGYTLSWTYRKFDNINFGKEYPYRYDRRHDISLVGTYKFNEKWSLNGSWVFYTGNAVTVPTYAYSAPGFDNDFHSWSSFPDPNSTTGSIIATSGVIENSESRNNYRLPDYHRLDVTATRKVQKKKSKRELSFGLTNAYNKMNPSFYYVSHEQNLDTGQPEIHYYTRTLFPLMPTISYKIIF